MGLIKYGEQQSTINKQQEEIEQLKETIKLRDKEIKDVKYSVAEVLDQIKELNEGNQYNDPSIRRRKISEICTDTRYELMIDELDKEQKAKIIELKPNRQISQ